MEFDVKRVYTSVNADELKVGSKCVFASDLATLKERVANEKITTATLSGILNEEYTERFVCGNKVYYSLAYLIEPPEEKVLKWTDLKIGDVIKSKTSELRFMVTGYDSNATKEHVFFGCEWVTDEDLADKWEKVE